MSLAAEHASRAVFNTERFLIPGMHRHQCNCLIECPPYRFLISHQPSAQKKALLASEARVVTAKSYSSNRTACLGALERARRADHPTYRVCPSRMPGSKVVLVTIMVACTIVSTPTCARRMPPMAPPSPPHHHTWPLGASEWSQCLPIATEASPCLPGH